MPRRVQKAIMMLRTMSPSSCSRVSTRAPCDFTLASSSFLAHTGQSASVTLLKFHHMAGNNRPVYSHAGTMASACLRRPGLDNIAARGEGPRGRY